MTDGTHNSASRIDYVKIYVFIVVSDIIICYFVYFFFPSARKHLVSEDKTVETISAILFFCAFLVGLFYLIAKRAKHATVLVCLATFLGLLGFVEELSFGGRFVGYKYPRAYDVRLDSVRDVIFVAQRFIEVQVETYGTLIYWATAIGALSGLTLVCAYTSNYLKKFLYLSRRHDCYMFIAIFLVFVVVAIVIDLRVLEWKPIYVLEEALEMNAALALIFSCLSIKQDRA